MGRARDRCPAGRQTVRQPASKGCAEGHVSRAQTGSRAFKTTRRSRGGRADPADPERSRLSDQVACRNRIRALFAGQGLLVPHGARARKLVMICNGCSRTESRSTPPGPQNHPLTTLYPVRLLEVPPGPRPTTPQLRSDRHARHPRGRVRPSPGEYTPRRGADAPTEAGPQEGQPQATRGRAGTLGGGHLDGPARRASEGRHPIRPTRPLPANPIAAGHRPAPLDPDRTPGGGPQLHRRHRHRAARAGAYLLILTHG